MKVLSKSHFLIINSNGLNVEKMISDLFGQSEYFGIFHNADLNDNGELKTPHYHIVLLFDNRVSTDFIINLICEYDCQYKPNMITDNYVYNLNRAVQYLTHKNELNKHLYDFDDIFTNNIVKLNECYNSVDLDSIPTDYLISLVENCTSRKELVMKLGAVNFNKYSKVLTFLWGKR